MDILDSVLGDAPEADAAPADQQVSDAQVQAPAPSGPARGADGRFAPTQAPAVSEAGSAAPAAEAGQPPPGYVPLSALMDQRDELKAVKAKLATYEGQQQRKAPQAPPSVFDDEDAFLAYQQEHAANVGLNVRLDISEEMARGKHGDEVVDAVQEWFAEKRAKSPEFKQEVLGQRNPYEYAINAMRREQALSKIDPADLDDYAAWKASRANGGQAQAGASQPAAANAAPPRPAPPTRSLASANSAGGVQHVPSGPANAFEGTFK